MHSANLPVDAEDDTVLTRIYESAVNNAKLVRYVSDVNEDSSKNVAMHHCITIQINFQLREPWTSPIIYEFKCSIDL